MDLPTIALTNVPSSTMVREADGFLLTQAGQEIAVASTKAFSTQIAALYWLAHRIALKKELLLNSKWSWPKKILLVVAEVLENSIENYKLDIMQTTWLNVMRSIKKLFFWAAILVIHLLGSSTQTQRNFLYFCTMLSGRRIKAWAACAC